jgi:hypothetical protein
MSRLSRDSAGPIRAVPAGLGIDALLAAIAGAIEAVFHDRIARLPFVQREALHQIATKLALILAGNAQHADHWRDLAGYGAGCFRGRNG